MTNPSCAIACTSFHKLHSVRCPSYGWSIPSRNMKPTLHQLSLCSTLTHSCEAWCLTKAVQNIINGFICRCIHITTGYEYHNTFIAPKYNMLLTVHQRRLRYLRHPLRLPPDTVVGRALMAMTDGGNRYSEETCSWTLKYVESVVRFFVRLSKYTCDSDRQ